MHPVAEHVLQLLRSYEGYPEKPNNLTVFAEELDAVEHPRIPRQGSPWCGTFQDWGFYKANAIPALLFRSFSTSIAAQHYIAAGRWSKSPQPGALAFLKTAGPGHVGFVISVGMKIPLLGRRVTTIEGNTSSGKSGSQTNGGMVAIRTRWDSFWAGFGMPDYDAVKSTSAVDLAGIAQLVQTYRGLTLKRTNGAPVMPLYAQAVGFLQRLLGVTDDGDFGPATEAALIKRQEAFVQHQINDLHIPADSPFILKVDGVCDAHTWAALLDTGG